MKIRDMQLLVRVAETGSMTLAARQMNLTPAAVSSGIKRLEETLGLRLFERTTRALHPTNEGLILIEGCVDLVGRWQEVLDDATNQRVDVTGEVHLSAPADTTYQVLESLVVDVCREHPKLRVVFHTSDLVHDIQRDAIDIAIRYGPLQDSSLTAHKLVELPTVLVAAPAYVAQHGAPESIDDLSRFRRLTLRLSSVPRKTWALHQAGVVRRVPVASTLCGDGYLLRRWAIAGVGIALKSLFDVIDDLEQGRLVRVLPDATGGPLAIHAVFPSRHFLPARVRTLDAAITNRFHERALRCRSWLGASSQRQGR